MSNSKEMSPQEYRNARNAIVSVTTARVICVIIATSLALKGDWTGAGLFIAAVPLLHFGLPVTR